MTTEGDEPEGAEQRRRPWWLFGIVALVVVVALVVGAFFLFKGDDTPANAGQATTPSPTTTVIGEPAFVASADDVGPVALVDSDVTCDRVSDLRDTVAAAQANGWVQRDPSVPASAWTPDQRAQYEAVGKAMRDASDAAVELGGHTPHRVMRELYQAFIAYSRAYAASLEQYQPVDDFFAVAAMAALSAISEVCTSARNGSVAATEQQVPPAQLPSAAPYVGSLASPERFLLQAGPTCAQWIAAEAALRDGTSDWAAANPNVAAPRWTPDQQAVQMAMGPVLTDAANAAEAAGRKSGYGVFEDLATLTAMYYRAFVVALPTYSPADHDLAAAGMSINSLVAAACQAAAN